MHTFSTVAFASAIAALALGAQSAADKMTQERMRQLDDFTKSVQNAQPSRGAVPLWGGPDDDPTLAADTFTDDPPPAARKSAQRAERFSKKQEHDKAIQQYRQALKIYPSYYEAENNLALEYFSDGDYTLAIDSLRQLTKTDSSRVLAYDNWAIILCRLHRYSEAEFIAYQAVKMHPFSYKANYVYGSSLVNQGKWTPEAKQSLRYASERHPEAKALLEKWPNSTNSSRAH